MEEAGEDWTMGERTKGDPTRSMESIFHSAVLCCCPDMRPVYRQGIPPNTPTHLESKPQDFMTPIGTRMLLAVCFSGSLTAGHHRLKAEECINIHLQEWFSLGNEKSAQTFTLCTICLSAALCSASFYMQYINIYKPHSSCLFEAPCTVLMPRFISSQLKWAQWFVAECKKKVMKARVCNLTAAWSHSFCIWFQVI